MTSKYHGGCGGKGDKGKGHGGKNIQAYIAVPATVADTILASGFEDRHGKGYIPCSFNVQTASLFGDVVLAVAGLDDSTIDRNMGRIHASRIDASHLHDTRTSCVRPGCGKPSWNGDPGQYCSKTCRDQVASLCARPGCGKPSWNGQPNEYCGTICRDSGPRVPLEQIHESDGRFQNVAHQFNQKWDTNSCGPCPEIKSLWLIHHQGLLDNYDAYCQSIGNVKVHGAGKNPGNQQRRFHRTSMQCASTFNGTLCGSPSCKACSVIKTGFLLKYCNPNPTWKHYGVGLYSSPSSSYGVNLGKTKFSSGAVFLCKVAVGVPDITDTTDPLPAGRHSRVASSTTHNPSDSELVVFNEQAIVPRYLILH
eukprot:TRINITY_DN34511_c0_g1_i1.p1 TRINITY_DN34511_c0_g1~~TRINITY_DN34511_c0_g1_i1.p1  ORF type:complete len:365 (-),score=34.58 TRINITY_DN34511_c0_g1_i1:84-1178(-)